MTGTLPDILRHAGIAREAVRAMNHVTVPSLPAPSVYEILGELKGVGDMLPQALKRISAALLRSLEEFGIREDDGGDPIERNALARAHLANAAEFADRLGDELGAAQTAIALQGFSEIRADSKSGPGV